MKTTCPQCNAPIEIWSDIADNTCPNCGYDWDLEDEEDAQTRLVSAVIALTPRVEEDCIGVGTEMRIQVLQDYARKAAAYDNARQHIAEFVADCMQHMTVITPENQQRLQDIVFSLYNEKNQTSNIAIYPSSE